MPVIKLATSRAEPAKRACATCAHAPRFLNSISICHATGGYIHVERYWDSHACGPDGRLWEQRPPRRGLIGTLRVWLFGE